MSEEKYEYKDVSIRLDVPGTILDIVNGIKSAGWETTGWNKQGGSVLYSFRKKIEMEEKSWTMTYYIVYDKYSGRQILSRRYKDVIKAEEGIKRWKELQFRMPDEDRTFVDPDDLRIMRMDETKTRID